MKVIKTEIDYLNGIVHCYVDTPILHEHKKFMEKYARRYLNYWVIFHDPIGE